MNIRGESEILNHKKRKLKEELENEKPKQKKIERLKQSIKRHKFIASKQKSRKRIRKPIIKRKKWKQ